MSLNTDTPADDTANGEQVVDTKPETDDVTNDEAEVTETPVVEDKKDDEVEPTDEVAKWKHHSRKNEENLKAALTREKEANDKLVESQAKFDALEKEKLKYEIAFTKGLNADALELLDGDTKEAIEEKAEKLLKLLGNKTVTFNPNPLQGLGSGDEKPEDNSPAGILSRMMKEAEGN